MITYKRGGIYFLLKVFQRKGSVFATSFRIALPCALATVGLKLLSDMDYIPWLGDSQSIVYDNGAWSGFSFLVGFLIVFRTSQAYARFWDGCTSTHQMRAEWYDACSAVVAFCKYSKVDQCKISVFEHTLVRLFSMLHALALAEIEDSNSDDLEQVEAFKYELIDVESIDPDSLRTIKNSDSKVELVYQWVQQLIVENIDTGVLSIPPPLLSRVFQEINNGMVQFHEAIKISTIPFPFPYAQTCDCLLLMHYFTVPFVMSQWVTRPVWAFIFSFVQVSILWSLNCIAVEIENPFGQDANDIDACSMQLEMNRHLSILLLPQTQRTPRIQASAEEDVRAARNHLVMRRSSFSEAWTGLSNTADDANNEVARTARRSSTSSSVHSKGSTRSLSLPTRGRGHPRSSDMAAAANCAHKTDVANTMRLESPSNQRGSGVMLSAPRRGSNASSQDSSVPSFRPSFNSDGVEAVATLQSNGISEGEPWQLRLPVHVGEAAHGPGDRLAASAMSSGSLAGAGDAGDPLPPSHRHCAGLSPVGEASTPTSAVAALGAPERQPQAGARIGASWRAGWLPGRRKYMQPTG